jgi:hypothetical protein
VQAAAQVAKHSNLAPKTSRNPVTTSAGEILVRESNLADRFKRTSGAIRFTSVVAKNSLGLAKWEYKHGETVNFRFEYEVLEKVPRLAFLFRLYLAEDQTSASQCVTDIFETVSTTPLEAGHRGVIDLTLPDLKLMPNNLRLYVCLTSPERTRSYDVLDNNVGLPVLSIRPQLADDRRIGAVSLEYKLRTIEVEEHAETGASPSIVATGES